MRKMVTGWLFQRGARVAIQTANEVVPRLVQEQYRQVFEVAPPVTVFVYASNARVTVRRSAENTVTLDADLRASFGWQLVAEQDEAGVYIVAKRKPIVGALSSAAFTLFVPAATRLLVDLTPGALILEDLNGRISVQVVNTQTALAIVGSRRG